MADSLMRGGKTATWESGDNTFPHSPFHPFSVSQKVWYDQAVTRKGEE